MAQYYLLLPYYLVDLFLLYFGGCYSRFCYYFLMPLSNFLLLLSWSHSFLLAYFSFSSLTVPLLSPFLCSCIPNLTFLFFLSIIKSKALVLSWSSNSSLTCCPPILLSCCSTFNLIILSLVFDLLYLLQFYFLVPIAELVV